MFGDGFGGELSEAGKKGDGAVRFDGGVIGFFGFWDGDRLRVFEFGGPYA